MSDFELQLDKFIDDLEGPVLISAIQKTVIDIYTGVIKKTPVDTGAARASWLLGFYNPPSGDNANFSGGEAAATSFGLTHMQTKLSTMTEPSVVFITNNLDYIEYLENGKSDQAPYGMVALTIAEVSEGMK